MNKKSVTKIFERLRETLNNNKDITMIAKSKIDHTYPTSQFNIHSAPSRRNSTSQIGEQVL